MTGERGYQKTSLPGWGALSDETNETNPDLIWPKSNEVYDRMRSEDAQVQSVVAAVQRPIRSATWVIDPAGARDEVVQFVARDLGLPVKGQSAEPPIRSRDRFSWSEHLRMALLCGVYGHSFFEQVYRPEGDRTHLRKLAWRPPRTISEIEVAIDGGLVAIVQSGLLKKDVRIPVDRLVAYVNDREGANWVGRSMLRPAYKNWLLKDRELRAQALTVERNGLGIPKYTAPPIPEEVTDPAEITERQSAQIEAGLKVAKDLRAGETAGVSLPHGAELELMGVTGKLPDTDGPIRYNDEQIARAVLAHFLNLGTETGSWALGSTFANFFTDSLNAAADYIRSITQQHVVEDLVDLNWGPDEPAPQLVFEPIGAEHPATAEAIKMLIECGALVADDGLEEYMRTRYGLPVRDEATARDDEADTDEFAGQDVGQVRALARRALAAVRNLTRRTTPEEDA